MQICGLLALPVKSKQATGKQATWLKKIGTIEKVNEENRDSNCFFFNLFRIEISDIPSLVGKAVNGQGGSG